MKKIIVLLSLITFVFACDKPESLPPNTYEITGTAKGVHNGMRAYLKVMDASKRLVVTDTAIVMNEMFSFKGKVNHASMQYLTINAVKGNLSFILEPAKLSFHIYKDDIRNSLVKGSANNETYNQFKLEQGYKRDAIGEVAVQIGNANSEGNTMLSSELVVKKNKMTAELLSFAFEFIDANPNSDFSLILLENLTSGGNQNVEKIKTNLASLDNIVNKNAVNKELGRRIEVFIHRMESQKNLEIGKVAPNFKSTTPEGSELSLNDIKGKATIIDFWASWCKPCRIENPNVVKVYNKYHAKGLEIISVSLDRDGQKERWLKAIEDDNMNWHHVSNLKFWNDPVAKLYNVTAIPATFILDEDGRIVAKKLRGDALEKQIAELLD